MTEDKGLERKLCCTLYLKSKAWKLSRRAAAIATDVWDMLRVGDMEKGYVEAEGHSCAGYSIT